MNEVSLVAVRDRREQVILLLSAAYAEDVIEMAAFEDRLSRAHAATDLVTLDALVADLGVPVAETALVPAKRNDALIPSGQRVLAVFSSIERRGAWRPPQQMQVSSVLGNVELDFREAQLEPGVTELKVRAVFGNIEITVPPQLAVVCEGTAIFGSFEHRAGAAPDPDRPVLRIVGSAVFGSVEVRVRLPDGEGPWNKVLSWAGALLGGKKDKPALPPAEQKALPPGDEKTPSTRDS
jgi:Cell wall-active antibiotics response 4TMS YvqF